MRERSGHKPARLYESERAVKERSFTFLEFSLNASRVESVPIKIVSERRVAGAARLFAGVGELFLCVLKDSPSMSGGNRLHNPCEGF